MTPPETTRANTPSRGNHAVTDLGIDAAAVAVTLLAYLGEFKALLLHGRA